jgi:hypothetical protein
MILLALNLFYRLNYILMRLSASCVIQQVKIVNYVAKI